MLDTLMTPETRKLGDAFESAGFKIRFVGGCVRDSLLGETPKDVDFCTDATPGEMKDIATANKFGFIATGISHGTATLVVDNEPFEVTTLRVDVETDGRHAEVEFTRSFEKDAERRDLTINAMSMDFAGNVYDYFNGREDLKNKVVRFVGEARQRVEEDFLRILRYFRFAARFDATMDANTLQMFGDPKILEGLSKVSVERFWQEMQKLLVMPTRLRIVDTMFKSKVNQALGLYRFNPLDFDEADDAISALSALIRDTDLDWFLTFWKLSVDEREKVKFLVANRSTILTERMIERLLVRGIPKDYLVSLASLQYRKRLVEFTRAWKVPVFPVRGQDLLALGMAPGPEVGKRLAAMKDKWIASRFELTKDELLVG